MAGKPSGAGISGDEWVLSDGARLTRSRRAGGATAVAVGWLGAGTGEARGLTLKAWGGEAGDLTPNFLVRAVEEER